MRNAVVLMHSNGNTYANISANTNIPISTIADIIKKHRNQGTVENKPRCGRPKKLDSRANRRLVREVKKKRSITSSELRNSLPMDMKNDVSDDTLRRSLHEKRLKRTETAKETVH